MCSKVQPQTDKDDHHDQAVDHDQADQAVDHDQADQEEGASNINVGPL